MWFVNTGLESIYHYGIAQKKLIVAPKKKKKKVKIIKRWLKMAHV